MTPTPCQLTSHRWRRWEQRVATVPRRQIEPEATSQSPGAVPHNQSEALQRHNSTTEALGANWGQPMTRWHNDTPATHLLHTRYTLVPTCFRVMQSATPIFLPGLTWFWPVGNASWPLDLILQHLQRFLTILRHLQRFLTILQTFVTVPGHWTWSFGVRNGSWRSFWYLERLLTIPLTFGMLSDDPSDIWNGCWPLDLIFRRLQRLLTILLILGTTPDDPSDIWNGFWRSFRRLWRFLAIGLDLSVFTTAPDDRSDIWNDSWRSLWYLERFLTILQTFGTVPGPWTRSFGVCNGSWRSFWYLEQFLTILPTFITVPGPWTRSFGVCNGSWRSFQHLERFLTILLRLATILGLWTWSFSVCNGSWRSSLTFARFEAILLTLATIPGLWTWSFDCSKWSCKDGASLEDLRSTMQDSLGLSDNSKDCSKDSWGIFQLFQTIPQGSDGFLQNFQDSLTFFYGFQRIL